MLTTSVRAPKQVFDFLKDIKGVFGPDTHYWPRKQFSIKEIQEYAINKEYTDLLIFREHRKIVSQLVLIHLPNGPTYNFKLTNITPCDEIHHHGRFTDHNPEMVLNNFNTKVYFNIYPRLVEEQAEDQLHCSLRIQISKAEEW